MGRLYSDQTLSQIQQATDIVELVSATVALKRRGKDYVGLCPFHREKTPSFTVSPSKQIFKCFGCGVGGTVFNFVMLREKISFPEAVRVLAERAGIPLPERGRTAGNGPSRLELAKVNAWAAEFFAATLQHEQTGWAARQYLQQRGISPDSIKRFRLGLALDRWDGLLAAAARAGFAPRLLLAAGLIIKRQDGSGFYDRFRNRLIFPIIDATERVIGFGGRAFGNETPKYHNSPATTLFDKSRCLYGLNLAREQIAASSTAVVVEGYTDVIMAHQHGMKNVVATLGTALTDEHVSVLSRYASRVVLVFDADQAGQNAANRALELFLQQRLDVRIASLSGSKDPCEMLTAGEKEKLQRLIADSPDALTFKWHQLREKFRTADSTVGQRAAIEQFLQIIARSAAFGASDPIKRGLLLNELAKLVGLETEALTARLNAIARRAGRVSRSETESTQSPSSPGPVPQPGSATEVAFGWVLDVLLNEPRYFERVRQLLQPNEFPPPLRKPAELVFTAYRRGRTAPTEILRSCDDLQAAANITELLEQGRKFGNFSRRLDDALARIKLAKNRQRREQITKQLMEASDERLQNELLSQLQRQLTDRS